MFIYFPHFKIIFYSHYFSSSLIFFKLFILTIQLHFNFLNSNVFNGRKLSKYVETELIRKVFICMTDLFFPHYFQFTESKKKRDYLIDKTALSKHGKNCRNV